MYFLKHKDDACDAFKQYIADISPYGTIKSVRSDQGGEFISEKFVSMLIQNKICHERSAPYSQHQNGKAERAWRTLFDMARCLLVQSGLNKNMWTYAVLTAAYVRNRCFNQKIESTPFEQITGKKPNIANMQPFGSTCFCSVQKPKKLENRSVKGIFIWYDRRSPAYLIYFPETQEIKKIRCVQFHNVDSGKPDSFEIPFDEDYVHDKNKPETQKKNEPTVTVEENETTQQCQSSQSQEATDLGKRNRTRPKYLDDYIVINDHDNSNSEERDFLNSTFLHYCYNTVHHIPTSYNNAMTCDEACKWQEAMDDEMCALEENDTFELTTLPPGRKAVGGGWVFNVKSNPNGEETYKARYVAKGFSQIPDIDFQETFSPTARITSVRTLVQCAVQNGQMIHQMDVKTAYLNAPIDCELYVEKPEGYVKTNEQGEKLVWKLRKSLYGLKQSGRNWNNLLHSHLIADGFTQSLVDTCVYVKNSHDENEMCIVLVWVDDILLVTKSEVAMTNIKKSLSKHFHMKDLGPISWFLGIEFEHEKDSISMGQAQYINKLLKKFNMESCKPKQTACDMNINKLLSQTHDDTGSVKTNPKQYREIVGSLIYIMTATRSDLCFVVTKLSQYLSMPRDRHMIVAKHVLRYLKATIQQKLTFWKSVDNLSLSSFCDSDWGSSEDRKSITGYCFTLSREVPLISWKSKKQQSVALSSCEAECMALSSATQEGKFLLALINDMNIDLHVHDFTLNCDNQGAIALSKNPAHHQRSKHIDIRYHFVRDEISNGLMKVQYVPCEENLADVFTKPVSKVKMQKLKTLLIGD